MFDAECDDGNTNSNDGCSSTCTKEPGFSCNTNQPTFCSSEVPLTYKFRLVEKVQSGTKGKITLRLLNSLSSLPFDFTTNEFQPSSTYVKLFIIESESPLKETEISETTLQDLSLNKDMVLEFDYSFTVEKLKARIEIDYSQTRYLHYVQTLTFQLDSMNSPLIYSANIETFTTISIVLCVGTALSMVGLIIGLCSPKYIGLESLLTLQLIFYSQLLIANPSKWPVGFMYLKYLKFSSGYNEILSVTQYVPYTVDAKKLYQLDMKKTIVENFNINFTLLALSFLVFVIVFCLKYRKESQMTELETKRKDSVEQGRKPELSLKESLNETRTLMKSVESFQRISEKIFWIVNHLSVWLILPLVSSATAHILISNELVEPLPVSSVLA